MTGRINAAFLRPTPHHVPIQAEENEGWGKKLLRFVVYGLLIQQSLSYGIQRLRPSPFSISSEHSVTPYSQLQLSTHNLDSIALGEETQSGIFSKVCEIKGILAKTFSFCTADEELFEAIESKDLEKIKTMIAAGRFDPNTLNVDGLTPLALALEQGDNEMIRMLLESGADPVPLLERKGQNTLLTWILKHEQYDLIPVIAKMGVKIDASLLGEAAGNGNSVLISKLIEAGVDVNSIAQEEGSFTALHLAAFHRRPESIKTLVDLGADINIRSESGDTPLSLAAFRGCLKSVKTLTNLGADVNAINKQQVSALALAVYFDELEIVKFLKASGANLEIMTDLGLTPTLRCMTKKYYQECPGLFGEDSFSNQIHAAKELIHVFELETDIIVKGKALPPTGWFPDLFVDSFRDYIKNFVIQNPGVIVSNEVDALIALLDQSIYRIGTAIIHNPSILSEHLEAIVKDIKEGKPVLIPSGERGHSVSVLFHGEHLVISNKGGYTRKPIELFKIDKEKVTQKTIQEIVLMGSRSIDDYKKWLIDVKSTFGADPDGLFEELAEAAYPFAPVHIGQHCAWESLETNLYAMLLLERMKPTCYGGDQEICKQVISKTNDDFARLMRFIQVGALEKYLKVFTPGSSFNVDAIQFEETDQRLLKLVFWEVLRMKDWEPDLWIRLQSMEGAFLRSLPLTDQYSFYLQKLLINVFH